MTKPNEKPLLENVDTICTTKSIKSITLIFNFLLTDIVNTNLSFHEVYSILFSYFIHLCVLQ